MKADTQYNDLFGTAAADISDFTTSHNDLKDLANYFKIDINRFKVIGLSVYGTERFTVSFICIDNVKSTEVKTHIVKIRIDDEYENILRLLFKRLHLVIYSQYEKKYSDMDYDEEIKLSDNI